MDQDTTPAAPAAPPSAPTEDSPRRASTWGKVQVKPKVEPKAPAARPPRAAPAPAPRTRRAPAPAPSRHPHLSRCLSARPQHNRPRGPSGRLVSPHRSLRRRRRPRRMRPRATARHASPAPALPGAGEAVVAAVAAADRAPRARPPREPRRIGTRRPTAGPRRGSSHGLARSRASSNRRPLQPRPRPATPRTRRPIGTRRRPPKARALRLDRRSVAAAAEAGAVAGRSRRRSTPMMPTALPARPRRPNETTPRPMSTRPATASDDAAAAGGGQRAVKAAARAAARPRSGSRRSHETIEEQVAAGGPTRGIRNTRSRTGRDGRRRRDPIAPPPRITDKLMVITEHGERDQIAVLEEDVLVQHYVTRAGATSMVGNVYLGRVQNVLPGMEAAFVDVGRGRNGVLYAGEVNYSPEDIDGPAPRIEQLLKPGQAVMVQVTKDPMGGKGARLTANLSLAGRYIVLAPNQNLQGISRRLGDDARKRLKSMLKRVKPPEHGVIVRTAAEGATEEELETDLRRLLDIWNEIQIQGEEGQGADRSVRGAGAHRSRGSRPVHRRGVPRARHRQPARLRQDPRLPARGRARPGAEGDAAHEGRCPRSRSIDWSSRSTRRSTRRCGCRPAATCSSSAPRR